MSISHYSYKYGHGSKEFSLESDRVIKEVTVAKMPLLEDVKAAILDAVYHPIGSAPINELVKPGQKIAFICNDPTRVANSFVFMPILVNEMNKLGIKDEDMHIVFALGTHRNMTHEEMVEAVGAEVAGRLKMYNSDAKVSEDFEYFGDTSRGTPVWLNKHICHVDHVIMLDPNAGLGKTVGNPVYEDQMEGVAMFAKNHSVFLFNAILNAQHEFLKIFAGDYVKAHQEACKFVDQVYGVEIPQAADLVIASCGGYPKDINVYQLQKTMDNAWCAVREGGVVIIIGECEEGSGSKVLEETCKRLGTADAIKADLEKHFEIGANKAFAVTRLTKKAKFILVSSLDKELAHDMLFEAVPTVEEALAEAEKVIGNDYNIILMPEGSLTVPLLPA